MHSRLFRLVSLPIYVARVPSAPFASGELGVERGLAFQFLLARNNHLCAITEAAEEFFAVLPTESELGDVSKAEPADNVSEKIGIGFVEVGVHHRALGPIDELRLADFAVQVVGNLVGNYLASDLHRLDFTTAYGPNRREISRARPQDDQSDHKFPEQIESFFRPRPLL